MALMVDLVLTSAASSALAAGAHALAPLSADMALALSMLVYFSLSLGYHVLFEWRANGRTPGKKIFRLRVMDEKGLPLTFFQVAVRNLLRPVDQLPVFYMVGGLAILAGKKAMRLGDLAARTVVAVEPDVAEPNVAALLPDKYNSLSAQPLLVARLRQRATQEQADLALDAVLARDLLDPDARVRVFAQLAQGLKGLVAFPEEAVEGLSDERFVTNAVRSLFTAPSRSGGAAGEGK
ncbi:MAG: RDD family protein [Deltaproteobacteria bacterium]|nr:RDD family protein [Deltaproteobacteria bacterium]